MDRAPNSPIRLKNFQSDGLVHVRDDFGDLMVIVEGGLAARAGPVLQATANSEEWLAVGSPFSGRFQPFQVSHATPRTR